MDLMTEETRHGYKTIAKLLEQLAQETSKLEEHQKKLTEHNHALSGLNKSFHETQSRLKRIGMIRCGSHLLNL